jgi:hypothetical protein
MNKLLMRLVLVGGLALASVLGPTKTASAIEIKPLMKDLGLFRAEIGKEIHLTHEEVQNASLLSGLVALKFPPAAPFIAAAIARIQREDRGNGAIVEVLWTGMIVGTRPR